MLDSNSESQTQLDGPPFLPHSLLPVFLLGFLALPTRLGQLIDHRVGAMNPDDPSHRSGVDDDLAP